MKVVVLGLGYVGSVCAGCLSRDGFDVTGVDINPEKVRAIEEGRSPVLESGLADLIHKNRRMDRLRASTAMDGAVSEAEVILISVGTPSASNGASDLSHLLRALGQLGSAMKGVDKYQVVNVRSTVPPGTMRGKVIPILEERSGRKVGEDFGVSMNPEFLREGTSIQDYDAAPFDLCGAHDARAAESVRVLYAGRNRPFQVTSMETAEMVKFVNNAFHALKIGFANEVGRLAHASGVDALEVMHLLCEDRRLNISPAYLRPGMAFGGSCLPKDLRALVHAARKSDVAVPLLEAILESNEIHLESALNSVLSRGRPRTAVVGLSFKAGTDDLRESPMVRLVEGLLGKGVPVKIYDRNVTLSSLIGANKDYIQREIPHIGSLLVQNMADALKDAEVVVVATDDPEVDRVPSMLQPGQTLIDLFGRLARDGRTRPGGICW